MSDSNPQPLPGHRGPWWREAEMLLLALLVAGIYFTRLGSPTLRGEETRWGTAARLHLALGDWVVPRQQGLVFAERPPLGNWLMACGMLLLGDASPWAVRLPSAIAMLATTLLVYGYSRQFLSRGGALAAAAALATTGEAMVLGRLGESEAVFTGLVSASLLVWHWGYTAGWPRVIVWSCGFALAGLAGLVKGPQGPVYFVSITGFYLLIVQRDWRALVAPAYLAGWLVFALMVGLWQAAFLAATDLQTSIVIWTGLASDRYHLGAGFLKHVAGYPFEVFISTLPWSVFLPCYLHRNFRDQLGAARPYVIFLGTAAAIAFLPLWLATGARTRYFMPLYPCLAVLVGVAIESCWRAATRGWWQSAWRHFTRAMAVGMPLAGAGIVIVSAVPALRSLPVAQGPLFAAIYGAAGVLLAMALARAGLRDVATMHSLASQRACVLAVAAFLGLSTSGVLLNALDRSANDIAADVDRVKQQLPPDARLVSFLRTNHNFAWHYRELIPALAWPRTPDEVPAELDYFCFETFMSAAAPPLPFAWEQVAEVNCERNRRKLPQDKVIIGRRIGRPAQTARAGGEASR